MSNALKRGLTDAHPFGGCDRILSQYQQIGAELLLLEGSLGGWRSIFEPVFYSLPSSAPGSGFSRLTRISFRRAVATISVEVLESYLDDLLDMEVGDSTLFIERKRQGCGSALISWFGLCIAMALGLYSVSLGAPFFVALTVTIFAALPFAVLWHYIPREKLLRRMRFARLLSHEIGRRRGDFGPMRAERTDQQKMPPLKSYSH